MEEYNDLFMKAISHLGKKDRIIKSIEEFSELIVELSKQIEKHEQPATSNLLGEIADAKIMLSQLEFIYGKDRVMETINRKIGKLKNVLKR